jgi:N-acetylmuramoyl-L-alanine amidase
MDIDRRRVLRRVALGAVVGTAAAVAAAGPPRHVPAGSGRTKTPGGGARAPEVIAPMQGLWTPLSTQARKAPKPTIVPRSAWQSDQGAPLQAEYDGVVRAVFVHHTVGDDSYRPEAVPGIIQSIYGDHRRRRGWDDIGYNFLVDRYGTIYEGRHGGIDRPVVGAHTEGFNHETVGIAVIGAYRRGVEVPEPVLEAVARLAAWKLGTFGIDPNGRSELTSTNSKSRYDLGSHHAFNAVSGHRDACFTECPGDALYAKLPEIIARAADVLHQQT